MSADKMSSYVLWISSSIYPDTSVSNDHTMINISLLAINNKSTEAGCIVLQFEEYVPWNNPDNIVSYETEDTVYMLLTVFFTPVLFLIACPANIINMIVFCKHGLKERINVCLFALSLADELYMIFCMLWFGESLYFRLTTRQRIGSVFTFIANNHLLGFHGFIWVSQVLSAIIASERCFCVLYPLHSQTVLRTSTMIFIIICVHVVILGLVFFEMLRYKALCAIDSKKGSQMIAVFSSDIYFRYKELIDFLDAFVMGVGLPGFVMIVVIITTMITTVKLRQAALWRAGTSSHSGVSERDVALTKMLVVNSVIFIICLLPFVVFRLVFLFMPEVNAGRRKHNFFIMIQSLLVIVSFINSTFNIVIYYTMGSRYRQTFWQLFGRTVNPYIP